MLFTPGNEAPKSPFDSTEAPTPTGSTPLPTPGRAKFTADVIDRLGQMEGEVSVAVSEAERREAVMLKQRHALQQAQVHTCAALVSPSGCLMLAVCLDEADRTQ